MRPFRADALDTPESRSQLLARVHRWLIFTLLAAAGMCAGWLGLARGVPQGVLLAAILGMLGAELIALQLVRRGHPVASFTITLVCGPLVLLTAIFVAPFAASPTLLATLVLFVLAMPLLDRARLRLLASATIAFVMLCAGLALVLVSRNEFNPSPGERGIQLVTLALIAGNLIALLYWLNRQRAEAIKQLRDLSRDLEQQVDQRTQDLAASIEQTKGERDFGLQVMNFMGQGLVITQSGGTIEFVNDLAARWIGLPPAQIIGRSTLDFLWPEYHAQTLTVRESRLHGQYSSFEAEIKTADGGRLPVLINVSPRREREAFTGGIVVLSDLSEQRAREDVLRHENTYLDLLNRVTLGLVQHRERDELLGWLVEGLRALCSTPHVFLELVDEDAGCMRTLAARGVFEKATQTSTALGSGIRGQVWQSGKPQVIQDYAAWPDRVAHPALEAVRAIAAAPVLSIERVAGVLGIAQTEPGRTITPRECGMLERLAQLAAVVLQTAQAYAIAQREIEDRRQAEAALRRQKEYLSALHETTLALVERLDLHELLEDIVTRACRLLGTPHGFLDLVSEDGLHLIETVTAGSLFSKLTRMRVRGEGMAGETWERGEAVVVEDYMQWPGRLAIPGDNELHAAIAVPLTVGGGVAGVLGIAHEDPVRRLGPDEIELVERFARLASIALEKGRLYEAVRAERDFAMQVMSRMGQGLTITRNDGTYEFVNQAFADMLGYSIDELMQLLPDNLVQSTELGSLREIRARRQQGESLSFEAVLRRKDGGEIPVLATVVPRLRGAVIDAGIAVFTDLSNRKQLELALTSARDRAEEASRLKSEFLATISHEIRTPMNAIMGMTELALGTQLNDEQRELLSIAYESSQSLLEIINDLLDFSKIEAGRLELGSESFDLPALVRNTAAMFDSRARSQGLALSVALEPGVPGCVAGDPVRLRQVLVNLLGNALKFTPDGSVTCRVLPAGGNLVRFEVVDTGVGISRVVRARLFEPFRQGDASTTRQYGGTGLGLAISRSLVHMMGGEIGVLSEEGSGSTFWFTARLRAC